MNVLTKEEIKEFKSKINKFFDEMKKLGYTAKQNFWCCQSCAWNALSDKDCKRVVFYHNQDKDDIPSGQLFISWNGTGKTIVDCAKSCGLVVVWNRRKNTRILLKNS